MTELRKVKYWFLAFYDSDNDIIGYSNKISLLHELGHKLTFKTNIIILYRGVFGYSIPFSLWLFLGDSKIAASIIAFFGAICLLSIEVTAWSFTFMNRNMPIEKALELAK
jgi:hypothetical protein